MAYLRSLGRSPEVRNPPNCGFHHRAQQEDGPPSKANLDAVRRTFETKVFGAFGSDPSSCRGGADCQCVQRARFAGAQCQSGVRIRCGQTLRTVQLAAELEDKGVKVNSVNKLYRSRSEQPSGASDRRRARCRRSSLSCCRTTTDRRLLQRRPPRAVATGILGPYPLAGESRLIGSREGGYLQVRDAKRP
jgi:hypothetical protein